MSGSMWSFSSFPKYDLSISFTLVVNHDYMMSEEYGLKVLTATIPGHAGGSSHEHHLVHVISAHLQLLQQAVHGDQPAGEQGRTGLCAQGDKTPSPSQ
jgi:hypothetical protein